MTQSGPQQSFIARNKRKLLLGGVGAVVIAVAAAVGIWYFFISRLQTHMELTVHWKRCTRKEKSVRSEFQTSM